MVISSWSHNCATKLNLISSYCFNGDFLCVLTCFCCSRVCDANSNSYWSFLRVSLEVVLHTIVPGLPINLTQLHLVGSDLVSLISFICCLEFLSIVPCSPYRLKVDFGVFWGCTIHGARYTKHIGDVGSAKVKHFIFGA